MIDGFYSQYLYTQRRKSVAHACCVLKRLTVGDLWRFFHFKQGSALYCHHKKWLRAVGMVLQHSTGPHIHSSPPSFPLLCPCLCPSLLLIFCPPSQHLPLGLYLPPPFLAFLALFSSDCCACPPTAPLNAVLRPPVDLWKPDECVAKRKMKKLSKDKVRWPREVVHRFTPSLIPP